VAVRRDDIMFEKRARGNVSGAHRECFVPLQGRENGPRTQSPCFIMKQNTLKI
jgi:hypothetical protein